MILCCGEALIDMLPGKTGDGQNSFVPHTGGAVFNTAVTLGRLGASVGMLTGLSRDMFGAQLTADLAASLVDTSYAVHSDQPSTLAFVKLVDGHATYSFFDENSAGRVLRFEDIPPLSDAVSALFFGGISLTVEPCAEAYRTLCDRAGTDRLVMMDPNIRPGFIKDEARYRERLAAMFKKTDIVKVSDEDLDWIFEGPESLREKVAMLLAAGPKLVVMTRGKDGAVIHGDHIQDTSVPSVLVKAVDTVGAGDSFNGGFLAKLSELGYLSKSKISEASEDILAEALAHGAKVAAITVSRAGANPPWAREL